MTKTGKLIFESRKPLGLDAAQDYYECVDCHTLYRKPDNQPIQCNGHNIALCPWCRPDSKPWINGRGK